MNRLILIGNGFDLAHGLKTSYKNFIETYMSNALNSFIINRIYDDPLITIKIQSGYPIPLKNAQRTYEETMQTVSQLVDDPYLNINFEHKSTLLLNLFRKIDTLNWVDVENEYFNELKECKYGPKFNYTKVELLNKQFNYLTKKLEEYLFTIQQAGTNINDKKYIDIFTKKIDPRDITLKTDSTIDLPENIHILSFNYTSTENRYTKKIKNINVEVNHIHGLLQNKDNPIIFGFGDEYDRDYSGFEEQKNNSLFEHIKSFGYFKTSNYHNLVRFLDVDDFQVFIIGHSCGLSDRTMLKEIFEHTRCKSIKIFYHKRTDDSNDFTEKTYEIARHFTDKGIMRKKIVPFNKSHCMPQH